MKYLIHWFLVIGTLFVPISSNLTKLNPTEIEALRVNLSSDTPVYSTCGGHLNDSLAAITYESVETILPNERCVWTIRTNGAIGYSLDVLSFGLEVRPGNTGIIASCLNLVEVELIQTNVDKIGAVNLGANCPILIITYFTGENVGTSQGFVLLYTATAGLSDVSDSSTHHIILDSEGHIRHPKNEMDDLTPNDLSTFVILPSDNTYNPEKRQHLTYLREGFGAVPIPVPQCASARFPKIRLHRFHPYTGWNHNATIGGDLICADVEYKKWNSDDILLAVFKTFPDNTGKGFHFLYTNSTC